MLTITEGLADIKTLVKRIEKKRNSVLLNLGRNASVKDPLEKEGGSFKFVASERQAIADLESRIVSIRTAIQLSNLKTALEIGGKKMSLAEWLTWRREISETHKAFVNKMIQNATQIRSQVQSKGGKVSSDESEAKPTDAILHFTETELYKEAETVEMILGELDGKLSLLNATTMIDV